MSELKERRIYSFHQARRVLEVRPGDVYNTLLEEGIQRLPGGFVDADGVDEIAKKLQERRLSTQRYIQEQRTSEARRLRYMSPDDFAEYSGMPADDVETLFRVGMLDGKIVDGRITINARANRKTIQRYKERRIDFKEILESLWKAEKWAQEAVFCDVDDVCEAYGLERDQARGYLIRVLFIGGSYRRVDVVERFSRMGLNIKPKKLIQTPPKEVPARMSVQKPQVIEKVAKHEISTPPIYIVDLGEMEVVLEKSKFRLDLPSNGTTAEYLSPEHVSKGFGYPWERVKRMLNRYDLDLSDERGVNKRHMEVFIEGTRRLNEDVAKRLMISLGYRSGVLTGLSIEEGKYWISAGVVNGVRRI